MSETILLVEDDPSLRRLIQRTIQKLGYTVIVAGSDDAAIASCRDHQGCIELLITDIMMAGMGGLDLAKQLRTARPDMKVLFVSGSNEVLESGLLTESDNFLQKPFSSEQVAAKIREILDR